MLVIDIIITTFSAADTTTTTAADTTTTTGRYLHMYIEYILILTYILYHNNIINPSNHYTFCPTTTA